MDSDAVCDRIQMADQGESTDISTKTVCDPTIQQELMDLGLYSNV